MRTPSSLRLHALSLAAAFAFTPAASAATEAWLTARASFGAVATDTPQRGLGFATSLSAGVRLIFPVGTRNAWTLTPDLGVAWTFGHGDANTTLASAGVSPGHLWGLTGVAWAPRVLAGERDDGVGVWGVRNGLRVVFVGGLFDVEVAHQYLRASTGDEQQMQFSVGVDPGMFAHMIARFRGPSPRPT